MKGFTGNITTGKLNSEMIFFTESVTTHEGVGIPAFLALSSKIGVLLESIMFSLEGITGLPKTSACKET
jgi:hypothetical protein